MTHTMGEPPQNLEEYSTPENIPPDQRPEGVAWMLLLQAVEAGDVTVYKRKSDGAYVVHCVDGDKFTARDFTG